MAKGEDTVAKKLKDYYDMDCAAMLADKIIRVDNGFDQAIFFSSLELRLDEKAFMERQDLFAEAFEKEV